MSDIDDFEATFKDYRYSDALVSEIGDHQHVLGGRTFFERLLELLGIKGRRMYPPKDDNIFAELHARIVRAPITLHYKHCLIFYLLKDLSPSHHHTPEISTAFANAVHLDTRFWVFIDGIWELDHLQFETAVGRLTYPGLIPTFPDEILMALLNRGDFHGMGGGNGGMDPLPGAYWESVRPPLADAQVRRKFGTYMAQRNVTEAYFWIRTRAEHEQTELLEILVEESFSRAPAPTAEVYPKEERAQELIALPFLHKEEKWMMHHLSQGKGRTIPGAQDAVQMMRLARGRFADFAKEGEKGRLCGGVNWDGLRDGVRRGVGERIREGV